MASAKFLRGISYFILGTVVCSLNPAKITFGMESIEDQGEFFSTEQIEKIPNVLGTIEKVLYKKEVNEKSAKIAKVLFKSFHRMFQGTVDACKKNENKNLALAIQKAIRYYLRFFLQGNEIDGKIRFFDEMFEHETKIISYSNSFTGNIEDFLRVKNWSIFGGSKEIDFYEKEMFNMLEEHTERSYDCNNKKIKKLFALINACTCLLERKDSLTQISKCGRVHEKVKELVELLGLSRDGEKRMMGYLSKKGLSFKDALFSLSNDLLKTKKRNIGWIEDSEEKLKRIESLQKKLATQGEDEKVQKEVNDCFKKMGYLGGSKDDRISLDLEHYKKRAKELKEKLEQKTKVEHYLSEIKYISETLKKIDKDLKENKFSGGLQDFQKKRAEKLENALKESPKVKLYLSAEQCISVRDNFIKALKKIDDSLKEMEFKDGIQDKGVSLKLAEYENSSKINEYAKEKEIQDYFKKFYDKLKESLDKNSDETAIYDLVMSEISEIIGKDSYYSSLKSLVFKILRGLNKISDVLEKVKDKIGEEKYEEVRKHYSCEESEVSSLLLPFGAKFSAKYSSK